MPKANPVSRNTKRHGRAAATALMLKLEKLSRGDHFISRAIAGITGASHESVAERIGEAPLPEDRYEDVSTKLFRAYLDGYIAAPPKAREGFADILGDYVTTAADGSVMNADAYEKPSYNGGRVGPSPRERLAHSRAWLKGAHRDS